MVKVIGRAHKPGKQNRQILGIKNVRLNESLPTPHCHDKSVENIYVEI